MNTFASKIGIICPHYLPEIGASAHRMSKMAEVLKNNNYSVEVFTALPYYPYGTIFPEHRGKIMLSENIAGILVNRYWIFASRSNRIIPRALNMLTVATTIFLALPRLLIWRPKIILINSPDLTLALSGVIMAKLSGAKIVLNVSDLWPLTAYELGSIKKGAIYTLLKLIEQCIYTSAHFHMGQSKEILHHMLLNSPPKPQCFYPNLSPTSQNINLLPKFANIKIVYAGLLGVAQGIFDLCCNIDFETLGVELHIYGDGYDCDAINKHIQQGLKNVYLHGVISKPELEKVMHTFHATIVPLKKKIYGAVPSKLYYAISCGIPVLFMGEGEGKDIVEENKLGWTCKPADYSALTSNIQTLQSMGAKKYQEMRRHIAELSTTKFAMAKLEQDFIQFISQSTSTNP